MKKVSTHPNLQILKKLLLFCLLTATLSLQADTTWEGNQGTDWNNADNWSAGVPDANDNVTIPNVSTNDPQIMSGTNAFAKSVTINSGGKLTNMGTLTIDGSDDDGILNKGTLDNSGDIIIGANMKIGNSFGNHGIENVGTFNNNGGNINIDDTARTGIFNNNGATLNNAAKITIGANKKIGEYGIENRGTFNNNAGGDIQIDDTPLICIFNNNGATFNNAAKITIGANDGVGSVGIDNFRSTFTNTATGDIQIDDTGNDGIVNSRHSSQAGTFTNFGNIRIGLNKTIAGDGIQNATIFNNNASGHIQIGTVNEKGIFNKNNIFNKPVNFTNAGKLTIGDGFMIGQEGIDNQKNFTNQGCASVINIASNNIINNTGTFNNEGNIIENASGNSSITNNTGIVQNLNLGTFTTGGNPPIYTSGHIWTGCVSTDWNTSTNWHPGTVPTATDNVTIPDVTTNDPEILGGTNAFAKSVIINSGGKLTNMGTLNIDGSDSHGLVNTGTVENSGDIIIGANMQIGSIISLSPAGSGIRNTGIFNNNAGGDIQIDNTVSFGISNTSVDIFTNNPGIFTNAAKITIGANKKIRKNGIRNASSTFLNTATGDIQIDDTQNDGILNLHLSFSASNFTNLGNIRIGLNKTIAGDGVQNASIFNNNTGGHIQIGAVDEKGIFNKGNIFNKPVNFTNAGKLTIGDGFMIGQEGIKNEKPFTNQGCAEIYLFDKLNNNSTFNNDGLFSLNTNETHDPGNFTNNGIVEDIQGTFPTDGIINNEVVVAPTTANGCETITPAFVLAGSPSFNYLGVYSDLYCTAPVGTINKTTNSFTTNSTLSEGMHDFFVKIQDGSNCTRVVSWKLTIQNSPPTAQCQGVSVWLNPNPSVIITPAQVNNGSFDNCGAATLVSVVPNTFDCNNLGANTVTLTVESNGLQSICTATVTVFGVSVQCYLDADGDSFGDAANPQIFCLSCGTGYVDNSGDCDDSNPNVRPNFAEICDGVDNNCDGNIDEGFDLDGDGYTICAGDCDDSNPNNYPGNTEICDGMDNNCDGNVDEGFDTDGDGYTICAGDCDDSNPNNYPGNTEICDGMDNNCDGNVDEGFDTDGDGYTICAGDCDDNNAAIYPSAPELCDGIDNDCNGQIDDGMNTTFVGNVVLQSQAAVDAFSDCISIIDGDLVISGAGILDLMPLSNLTEVTGDVVISQTSLSNLAGLEALTDIGAELNISINPNLNNLFALSNLSNLGSNLNIVHNLVLPDLQGLEGLSHINGILNIYANMTMTSLSGLDFITTVNGSLNIMLNPNLMDCCPIYGLLSGTGVTGMKLIFGNATDCENETTILVVCSSSSLLLIPGNQMNGQTTISTSPSIGPSAQLILYPNPATEEINLGLKVKAGKAQPTQYILVNAQGMEVRKGKLEVGIQSLNISDLTAGMYYILMEYESGKVQFGERFTKVDW